MDEIADRHRTIDEAAKRAGRDPGDITRAANIGLEDPHAACDSEAIARLATEHGFELLLLSVPDDGGLDLVRRLGEEVAPRVRELAG